MPVAIKIENLSKQYRLGLVSTRTFSHDLNRWWTVNIRGKEDPYLKIGDTTLSSASLRFSGLKWNKGDYIWALRDINLEVAQGEVLGIIGKNGAGKSTLLKILSKVTAPTTGIIKARGRIASLLEVGTGFHPEMTGRENIFMNGAILGMTKAEIQRKFDEIVDFSGVEKFIDTPVKRYSSGMIVRLGFAVAAHLDPEILVVDEVLAVGDAEFQRKAVGKMQDISQSYGRTVLFVSHNMAAVKNICNKGLVLNNGYSKFYGEIDESLNYYLIVKKIENILIKNRTDRIGNGVITVDDIKIFNELNEEISEIFAGQRIKVRLYYKKNTERDYPIIPSISIRNQFDQILFSHHSRLIGIIFNKLQKSGFFELEINSLAIVPGTYKIGFSIISENILIDYIDDAKRIKVIESNFYGSGEIPPSSHTQILLNGNWKMENII